MTEKPSDEDGPMSPGDKFTAEWLWYLLQTNDPSIKFYDRFGANYPNEDPPEA